MSKRTFLIITRELGNEFLPYWDGNNKMISDDCNYKNPIQQKINDDFLIIIDGEDFNTDTDLGANLKKIIECTKLKEILINTTIIGLISHGFENRDISSLSKDYNIAFNEEYSSTKGADFCQHDNNTYLKFVANVDPTDIRIGVLDALRDALVFPEQKHRRAEAFDNLWKYFDNGSTLNIKLKILHQCLSPNVANTSQWPPELNNEKVAKDYFDQLNGIDSTDPFDSKYMNALTDLRDSLLSH